MWSKVAGIWAGKKTQVVFFFENLSPFVIKLSTKEENWTCFFLIFIKIRYIHYVIKKYKYLNIKNSGGSRCTRVVHFLPSLTYLQ